MPDRRRTRLAVHGRSTTPGPSCCTAERKDRRTHRFAFLVCVTVAVAVQLSGLPSRHDRELYGVADPQYWPVPRVVGAKKIPTHFPVCDPTVEASRLNLILPIGTCAHAHWPSSHGRRFSIGSGDDPIVTTYNEISLHAHGFLIPPARRQQHHSDASQTNVSERPTSAALGSASHHYVRWLCSEGTRRTDRGASRLFACRRSRPGSPRGVPLEHGIWERKCVSIFVYISVVPRLAADHPTIAHR